MRTVQIPVKKTVTADLLPRIKVSAVLITYNEEHCIAETLSKLQWCDEIIIVDSYSTDNTVSVCREFGCNVSFRSFDGFGSQKKHAVSLAKNDWILAIDADEVLTDALIAEFQEQLSSNSQAVAFSVPMNLVFLNKEFKKGKESSRSYIRLFNKQHGNFSDATVHEGIEVNGKTVQLKNRIKHYSYTSVRECLDKCNRYSTYSADISFRKGKSKSAFAIIMGLPFNFFKYYFLELNFLNGLKGFYWSIFSSYYHFAKYVKLREMHTAAAASSHQLTLLKQIA